MMNVEQLTAGEQVPEQFNVVIEIPERSDPVKYEVDKATGALVVDRFMATAMYYPANYGYIPKTLSEDGDPVDVLVITPTPLISGCMIPCRPIGLLKMTDESGVDAKILAVPIDKLAKQYQHIQSTDDVCPQLLKVIEHFFAHYKDLEEGKWVKVDGWHGVAEAKQEVMQSVARFAG